MYLALIVALPFWAHCCPCSPNAWDVTRRRSPLPWHRWQAWSCC